MKKRTVVTTEMSAEILRMYRAGEKGDYIAALVGVSASVVFRIAKNAGLARDKGRRPAKPSGSAPGGFRANQGEDCNVHIDASQDAGQQG